MSKKISKQITYWLGVVAVGLVAGLGIQFVQAGWTEPSGLPGAVNVAAPVNVGSVTQRKTGALGVDGVLRGHNTDISAVFDGKVGIGTTSPSAGLKLDVEGKVGATAYCDQDGNNCNPSGGSIPSGAIMAFYLSSCPAGWKVADGTSGTPDLRGAFIRGMNGNMNGRDAARALGNYQNDAFKVHTHSYDTSSRNYNNDSGEGGVTMSRPSAYQTGVAGEAEETRPKNVVLLYCQKN